MNNILNKICNDKKIAVEIQKQKVSVKDLQILINNSEKPRGFKKTIDTNFRNNKISIIAEIKKASPSKGIICDKFNPSEIAKKYTAGNATCISVLTDEKYFLGSVKDLKSVKKNSIAPILRKDFIIDEYQIFESRAIGADCILLIHGVLDINAMNRYIDIANDLSMDVLVETHSLEQLNYWLNNNKVLLGINNRNLKNMYVDINHSINLIKNIKKNINIICESGIINEKDIDNLLENKFKTFLIGELLMRSNNPDKLLKIFLDKC